MSTSRKTIAAVIGALIALTAGAGGRDDVAAHPLSTMDITAERAASLAGAAGFGPALSRASAERAAASSTPIATFDTSRRGAAAAAEGGHVR